MTAATWHKYGVYYEAEGPWSIVITKGGATKLFEPPGKPNAYPLTTMPTAVTGTSVVFGPTADRACSNKGTYIWKISGRTLSLKLVRDACQPRRILYTAGLWKRE